jgi:ssDNA-binding Zn-finger/Zn-ribbon topoisomerase 1
MVGKGTTELTCPECGSPMVLRDGKYGKFYGCINYPECTGAHGVHQRTGKPLGTPATKETRKMRTKAHNVLDKLWKGVPKKDQGDRRKWVYRWLRLQMGMTAKECHIGKFTLEQCKQVIEICKDIKSDDPLICVLYKMVLPKVK